jgi:carbon monoxide dehydrogenase subunit G
MAKFPTEVERSIDVDIAPDRAYSYLADVVGSSPCVPGLDRCEAVGTDTYRFTFEERSTGPISMIVCYTARYDRNGKDTISYRGTGAPGDNTDVEGTIRIEPHGSGTRITMQQKVAPDTPVPRLVQGLVRSFVEREATAAVDEYLANVSRALKSRG